MRPFLSVLMPLLVIAIVATATLPNVTWAQLGPNLVAEAWGLVAGFLFATLLFETYRRQDRDTNAYHLLVMPAVRAAGEVLQVGGIFISGFDGVRDGHSHRVGRLVAALKTARRQMQLFRDVGSVQDRESVDHILRTAKSVVEFPDAMTDVEYFDKYLAAAQSIHGTMRSLIGSPWRVQVDLEHTAKQFAYAIKQLRAWRDSGDASPRVFTWPPQV